MPKIIPLRELKNASKISEICNETNEPIFVTKNGVSNLVILTSKEYDKLLATKNHGVKYDLQIPAEVSVNEFRTDNTKEVAMNWQANRYKKYKFPLIANSKYFDVSRVHPLKQKLVCAIVEILKKDSRIKSVVLFGSSTTIRCNQKSDLDLAITLKKNFVNYDVKNEVSEMIQTLVNWNADIIWMDRVKDNSKLYKNIEMGVELI